MKLYAFEYNLSFLLEELFRGKGTATYMLQKKGVIYGLQFWVGLY